MKNLNPAIVLSIAGSDPGAGAGIQADLKAISATGAYAVTVITALTAQNTQGVQSIYEVAPEFIAQQLTAIFADFKISAVKIGMLLNEKVIRVVAEFLEKYQPPQIVIDPVMVSKNGSALLELSTLAYLKEKLLNLATLITPNIFEAESLVARKISTREEMLQAAQELALSLRTKVLVKGGHLAGEEAADLLCEDGLQAQWFYSPRISTLHTHGTGCSLSAAIASYLAQGYSLVSALTAAKKYVTSALSAGANWQLGKGQGPLDHFYQWRSKL